MQVLSNKNLHYFSTPWVFIMTTTLHVYKSTLPSCSYIFKNGKQAPFISQVFRTDVPTEIDELDGEVAAGHPHIYIDANEKTVESDMLDPMAVLKARFFAQFQAEQAAATNPSNDMGSSDQTQVVPANSQDIASAAVGGSGEARLVNLPGTPAKK